MGAGQKRAIGLRRVYGVSVKCNTSLRTGWVDNLKKNAGDTRSDCDARKCGGADSLLRWLVNVPLFLASAQPKPLIATETTKSISSADRSAQRHELNNVGQKTP